MTTTVNGSFPQKPTNVHALSDAERKLLFGTFTFKPNPLPGNPEAIAVDPGWTRANIVSVDIPQLAALKKRATFPVPCHKAIAMQLVGMFDAWAAAGLSDRVLSYDGCYVPRFIRGSKIKLSNHSWGTAIDLNARWNPLGTYPSKIGETGCVRELVEIALAHGFYWGGWFSSRRDPQHFEAFRIL